MSTLPDLITIDDPIEADKLALVAALRADNDTQVTPFDPQPVAILIQTDGVTVGGLSGRSGYGWMFVDYLVLPAALRGSGLGTRLMQAAEEVARERGCIGMWLDTFSFQARGFYVKPGFTVFGTIDDYPIGHRRFYLSKRLP